jgi:hypothetical protein
MLFANRFRSSTPFPILLGEGVPLFGTVGTVGRDIRLKLLASRSFDGRLVQLEYQPGA